MRTVRRRAAAALVVLLVASGCSGGGEGAQPTTTTTTEVADPPAPSPRLEPGEVAHEVGTSFEYGSFIITIGTTVFDPEAQALRMGVRYRNVSGGWAQTDATAELELADGSVRSFFGDLFDVPPSVSVDSTLVATPVPEDPREGGLIRWGSPSVDRPVVRLDGSGGEDLWLPVDVPVDGWAQIGKFAVHVTSIGVRAGQVDLGFPAPAGSRVVRVHAESYTARGTTSPFDPRSHLLLRLPSGEVLDAADASTFANELSWSASGGHWADFIVPADLDGDYEVLLASIGKVSFGIVDPTLIERRGVPFELEDIEPGDAPLEPLAFPGPYPAPPEGAGEGFDVALDVGSMNIPGFDLRPTRLTYDPAAKAATLEAVATSLIQQSGEQGGVLSVPPSYAFRTSLASGGRLSVGLLRGDGVLDVDRPTSLTFDFSDVRSLDPDAAGLFVGAGEGAVASMPLGVDSDVVAWPPPPEAQQIVTPEVVAGDWTVQLEAYRLGLFDPAIRPALGRRQLEIALTATAAPDAQVRALGLSFHPRQQVLLGGGSGYDQGAVTDSGFVEYTPGQSARFTVTFDVPETFQPGSVPFVVRSRPEFAAIIDHWIETRFLADLTSTAAEEAFE